MGEIGTALGVVFVTLKLCKIITWSWWYVLMPFYIGWALVLLIFLFAYIVSIIRKD
jgi:hypothetical protein